MDKNHAKFLLEKTRKDYNLISEEFSSTRHSVWPEIYILKKYTEDGDKILDLGCGNGRLLELFQGKKIEYFGVDNSEKLVELAKRKYPEANFQTADAFELPFPDNRFDKVYSVAVLHHIPSKELRLKFLDEVSRVLKPGGSLILTAWDLWGRFDYLKTILKFASRKVFFKSELDLKDIIVPWQNKVDRYVHCFTKGELRKLIKESKFSLKEIGVLERKGAKNKNFYLVAVKE
ncbi:MAG: methyltransferase domain-containing protein [Candidatus Nealsonbacteria bacterium]